MTLQQKLVEEIIIFELSMSEKLMQVNHGQIRKWLGPQEKHHLLGGGGGGGGLLWLIVILLE